VEERERHAHGFITKTITITTQIKKQELKMKGGWDE
jgi:hypothetical protein